MIYQEKQDVKTKGTKTTLLTKKKKVILSMYTQFYLSQNYRQLNKRCENKCFSLKNLFLLKRKQKNKSVFEIIATVEQAN